MNKHNHVRYCDSAVQQPYAWQGSLDDLLDEVPLGVCVVDAGLRLLNANSAARAIFGGDSNLADRDVCELIRRRWPAAHANQLIRLLRRTLRTGVSCVTSEHIRPPGDQELVEAHEWRMSRVRVQDGRDGVACFIRDNSAHIQARNRLRVANQQKDEFLAILAHELRGPLAPIQNASEVLLQIGATHQEVQALAGCVKRQAEHMARLVEDLLEVARITQGCVELRCATVLLDEIIHRAVEMASPLIQEKHHELLWLSTKVPIHVRADSVRMTQALVNILTNCAKYTDTGGEIRIVVWAEETNAIIRISDNGAGIGPQLLPRIFEPFVQDTRTKARSRGGLGIGLSVARQMIELHGGTVAVSSPGPGAGSTFEVRLPMSRPS